MRYEQIQGRGVSSRGGGYRSPVHAMLVLATEVSALSTVYHMQTLIVGLAYTMNVLLILNYIYFAFARHHSISFHFNGYSYHTAPPLTLTTCPLIQRLASVLKKRTTSAISSGVPIRFAGLKPAIVLSICSGLPL